MSVYRHYDNSNQVASFISGGSVLNGQVQDAEEALALHLRMKIQFLGSHTITLPGMEYTRYGFTIC
jgi:hypothetical protein